jgi:hypothetical protein
MAKPRGAGSSPLRDEPLSLIPRQKWDRLHGAVAPAVPSPGFLRSNIADSSEANLGTSVPSDQLQARLAALAELDLEQLRTEWQRLYRSAPPLRLSRDLLQRSIAHRLQEEALGGLPPAVQRRLAALVRALAANREPAGASRVKLKAGATLVREWHGRTHTVLVLDRGFEHNGKHYMSLTQIAHAITGAHWSGPRFFGLRRAATTNNGAPEGG